MMRQLLDHLGGIVAGRQRLGREPFVEHQCVVRIAVVEDVERGDARIRDAAREGGQRGLPIGHVVGAFELREGERGAGLWIGGGDIIRSEEHTSELQSLMRISYAVFCLKKKKKNRT